MSEDSLKTKIAETILEREKNKKVEKTEKVDKLEKIDKVEFASEVQKLSGVENIMKIQSKEMEINPPVGSAHGEVEVKVEGKVEVEVEVEVELDIVKNDKSKIPNEHGVLGKKVGEEKNEEMEIESDTQSLSHVPSVPSIPTPTHPHAGDPLLVEDPGNIKEEGREEVNQGKKKRKKEEKKEIEGERDISRKVEIEE